MKNEPILGDGTGTFACGFSRNLATVEKHSTNGDRRISIFLAIGEVEGERLDLMISETLSAAGCAQVDVEAMTDAEVKEALAKRTYTYDKLEIVEPST